MPRRLLITGGGGFIGSNGVEVIVRDNLSYAGNLRYLDGLESDERFHFVQGDIADREAVEPLAARVDAIVTFAAESHVDRSTEAPDAFIRTDAYGTFVLLEAARRHGHQRYLQVSTDEVDGDG